MSFVNNGYNKNTVYRKDSRNKLRVITHKSEFHQNINRFNQINLIIDWNE